MIITFALFGLSQDQTYWVILGFCAVMVFLVFYGERFFSRRTEKGIKKHAPTNFYLWDTGYPRRVPFYEENELRVLDEERGIVEASAIATLEEGERRTISLNRLEPMSWETVDGKWNDKRIWKIRPEFEPEKILKRLNETETYVNTLLEALRKSRAIPEQFEEQTAEHFRKVREAVVPPMFIRPQDRRSMGSGYSGHQEVNP